MPQVVARLDVLQRLQEGWVLRIAQACKLVLKPLCSDLGLQHSIRLNLSLHHPNASLKSKTLDARLLHAPVCRTAKQIPHATRLFTPYQSEVGEGRKAGPSIPTQSCT